MRSESVVSHYNPVIERMSHAELRRLQFHKLQYQLEFLYHRNPFYRAFYERHNLKPEDIRTWEDFRTKVPTLTKKDFLADAAACPPYGQRLGVEEEEVAMTYLTSGTSGVGQEVYGHTLGDVVAIGASGAELFHWAGLRPGDRVFHMTPIALLAFGLVSIEGYRTAGLNPFYAFQYPSEEKLRLMRRFPPQAIFCTPTHLCRLATIAREMNIDPRQDFPTLKTLLVAGQDYPTEVGLQLEEVWGTRLSEAYGSSQGIFMAATCEQGAFPNGHPGGMHILEHRCILEIVDPETRQPVKSGEMGVGIVTNLDMRGSALVRFETGDRMRYLGPGECPCGRAFPLIACGSISRHDDMLKIRGMNIWPSAVDAVLFHYSEIGEYVARVYVAGGLEEVEIETGFKEHPTCPQEERERILVAIRRELKEKTNVTMQVKEVPLKELPVFEFKAVRWTDTRRSDLAKKAW
ncbi:MAG: phenylacetate--CoA ligase family protein [Candidatus Binatia bacterium]